MEKTAVPARVTHWDLSDWLISLDPQQFWTLTFGKKWPDGPTETAVAYHVGNWWRTVGDPLTFCVAERGSSGSRRWHAHGLLLGVSPNTSRSSRDAMWQDWRRRYGRCTFSPVVGPGSVARYCAKYCVKPLYEDTWWIQGRTH